MSTLGLPFYQSHPGAGTAVQSLIDFDADLLTYWERIEQATQNWHCAAAIHGGEHTAALHYMWQSVHEAYIDYRCDLLKRVDEYGGLTLRDRYAAWPIEEPKAEAPKTLAAE